ncbi:YkvA family protein [Brevibacillus massiliensis]|uniref:YkvA family protein n=1 Tax=Brevibacillus massiliensis TaxID=1118054 RepID=UPI0002E7AA88|nr:DUF1232 domain-containing protein [Brevibacillus massiliensis]
MNENSQHEEETNPNLPVPRDSYELTPIQLPKEHQRFYDKLRAKIEKFIRDRGLGDNAAGFILLAPDLFVLLARLLRDKRVPLQAKTIAGVAVAYFISPVDFIPEAIVGPLGMMDDVVLAVFALRSILVDVDSKIVAEHWNGQQDLLEVITKVVKQADELIGKNVLRKIENLLFGKK